MPMHLHILSREVIDDVRSAAWLESQLHPELDLHRQHEMADICEPGNIERVWRVLGLSMAEARMALTPLLADPRMIPEDNILQNPPEWRLDLRQPLSSTSRLYLREKVHELLVARVMSDRTGVIIPQATPIWSTRAETALSSLAEASSSLPGFARRPLTPF